MSRIHVATWYQRSHITGPSAVLVSVRFGDVPEDGPQVIRFAPVSGNDATIKFDVKAHVEEILSGVKAANEEFGGNLSVAAIQVVPDDYPSPGQAKHAAYLIAKYAITGNE